MLMVRLFWILKICHLFWKVHLQSRSRKKEKSYANSVKKFLISEIYLHLKCIKKIIIKYHF